MGENVIDLPVQTTLPHSPERVLRNAQRADLRTVIVLGYDQKGAEVFASSTAEVGTMVVLLERMKLGLLTEKFGPLEQD